MVIRTGAPGMLPLGILLFVPQGVSSQDTQLPPCSDIGRATSIEALLPCAEKGNTVAQLLLAARYALGVDVPEDDAEAVRWYRLAADQGYAAAQSNLGIKYEAGDGVPEDVAEAVRWFRLAADQGYAQAQFNLGVKYALGDGVPEDFVLAYMWWNLSTAQGNETAQKNVEIVAKMMTRGQIVEAQKLSREWLERHR